MSNYLVCRVMRLYDSVHLTVLSSVVWLIFFYFKQKTAYEMRISDWSSDVCSSDLTAGRRAARCAGGRHGTGQRAAAHRLGASGTASPVARPAGRGDPEIGRAPSRESVCQYVSISVVAVSLPKQTSKLNKS